MTTDSPHISPTAHTEDGYCGDDWPLMPDGTEWNGKDLLGLSCDGSSPFGNIWDVRILLGEVEIQVQAREVDVPRVYAGANNYVRTVLTVLASGAFCAIGCLTLTMRMETGLPPQAL